MNRVLILIIAVLLLFSGCDSPIGFNIFSPLRNTDNVSVSEAIASGDEELMTEVYEREVSRLASVNPLEEPDRFNQISLGIADLQTARSKAVFLFLALVALEVSGRDVAEVITDRINEDFLREVTDKIRSVISNSGKPSPTQNFISILGLVVWWFYVAEDIGLDISDMINALNENDLSGYLSTGNWSSSSYYEDSAALEADLTADVEYMSNYLEIILSSAEIEQLPALKKASINTRLLYHLES